MKIVVYGPDRRVGALVEDRVVDLNRVNERIPADLESFISLGPAALEDAQEALAHLSSTGELQGERVSHARSDVRLHAPTIYRPRIACAGANYVMHAAGTRAALQGEHVDPQEIYKQAREAGPWGFWKVITDIRGDEEDVVYPGRARLFDYEGEVAVVFGRRASDIPAARASDVIWGVTLLNDWSIRNDMGPGRPLSFNLAKNFDTSASLGPCIVVGELDPMNVAVETRVNGDLRQQYNSGDMTFNFAELIEFLSRDFTFQPGDILAAGTGAGTAMDSSPRGPNGYASTERFLKAGDQVEVSSPGIGALRNRIVARIHE
jgi:2-keto-4-pentenoate hydratase/2-oxohepta-3-ene-1,7-dioic acid hydratase in catechol pathway